MHDHRLFAATYDLLNRVGEVRVFRPLRTHIAGGARGRVLEIGAGTGANFPFYRPGVELRAVEPNPFMLRRARDKARTLGLAVAFTQCIAEALPFPDASFDTVVITLVLCTVTDQHQALREVHRVLRPTGTLRFIEKSERRA